MCYYPLSLPYHHQFLISCACGPGLIKSVPFHNMSCLYGNELQSYRPNPRVEDHSLLTAHSFVFRILTAPECVEDVCIKRGAMQC